LIQEHKMSVFTKITSAFKRVVAVISKKPPTEPSFEQLISNVTNQKLSMSAREEALKKVSDRADVQVRESKKEFKKTVSHFDKVADEFNQKLNKINQMVDKNISNKTGQVELPRQRIYSQKTTQEAPIKMTKVTSSPEVAKVTAQPRGKEKTESINQQLHLVNELRDKANAVKGTPAYAGANRTYRQEAIKLLENPECKTRVTEWRAQKMKSVEQRINGVQKLGTEMEQLKGKSGYEAAHKKFTEEGRKLIQSPDYSKYKDEIAAIRKKDKQGQEPVDSVNESVKNIRRN